MKEEGREENDGRRTKRSRWEDGEKEGVRKGTKGA